MPPRRFPSLTVGLLTLGMLAVVMGTLIGVVGPAPLQAAGPSGAVPLEAVLQQAQQQSPQLLRQMLLALVMTLLCTVIHLLISGMVAAGYESAGLMRWASRSSLRRLVLIACTALLTFLAMVLEILAWAVLFLRQGAVASVEQALYFSSVTFASLGYGDITLAIPFRLLASLEALVGILMAGWSTALLVALAQKCLILRFHGTARGPDPSIAPTP
jgi:hypothetical protein